MINRWHLKLENKNQEIGVSSCAAMFYKKYIFGLDPVFLAQSPKTPGISSVMRMIKVFFIMLLDDFCISPKDKGWLSKGTNHIISGSEFQSQPLDLQVWVKG